MKDKKLAALVTRAIKLDKKAFAELCELKVREVAYLCIRELGNVQDGQDAAQEVFIRMQTSIGNLRSADAFNVWLNRIIFSVCQDMNRRRMRRPVITGDEDAFKDFFVETLEELPETFVEEDEKRQVLVELIDDLPGKYRRCVLLHYYEGMRYSEIAETLDIPESSVENNLRMARKYLKQGLEERYGKGGVSLSYAPMVAIGPALFSVFSSSAAVTVPEAMAGSILAGSGIGAGIGKARIRAPKNSIANSILSVSAAAATLAVVSFAARNIPQIPETPDTPPGYTEEQPSPTESIPLPETSPVTLRGQVVSEGETLPAGLTVTLSDGRGREIATTALGSDGGFVFENLPLTEAGEYTVHVNDPDNLLWDNPVDDHICFIDPDV